jgi:GNAT superfamily N-acetyltransferase
MNPEEIRIEVKRGAELESVIPAVSRLRTEVFREWPYLDDGDLAWEERTLRPVIESPRAAVVIARANEAIVGAATCVPLVDEIDDVKAPIVARGWDPARFFHYGECVVRLEFRGQGIGVALGAAMEAHAKAVSDCDCRNHHRSSLVESSGLPAGLCAPRWLLGSVRLHPSARPRLQDDLEGSERGQGIGA